MSKDNFDPTLYALGVQKKKHEEQLKAIQANMENRISFEVEEKLSKRRGKYEQSFGLFGKYILEVGTGGGFTAIPHALDIYEGALGLSRDETWFMKRLMRYLPNVHPSMAKIAKEAGVSEPTLSRIKKGLVAKGFIRDNGKHSSGALQHELNIAPIFDAAFLCALCDPNSKLVIGESVKAVRTEFTAKWQGNDDVEYYARQENFPSIDLPLSIDAAKIYAAKRGFTLNWQAIAKMQNSDAMEKLEAMKADKMRLLELKDAINAGLNDAFKIQFRYSKAYQWLLWLASMNITDDEVMRLTASYIRQAETPSAKEYMEWMREVLQQPSSIRILAGRDVMKAQKEAAYAE